MTTPAPSDAIPEALADALQARRRRRAASRKWVIVEADATVDSFAATINSSKHQRLSDRFRPDGWITEYL
jgi:hypothetical protein